MKYRVIFREHFRQRSFFTVKDARRFLESRGITPAYLKVFIHHELKKGSLKRLGRGVYSFQENLELVGNAFRPFYYGLQSALSFHGLWDQATNLVVLTPKKVRPGIRRVWNQNVFIRRISPNLFFGFSLVKEDENWIPVSDVEKTFIDWIYFRQKMSLALRDAFFSHITISLLNAYLKKTPKWVRARVKKITGM